MSLLASLSAAFAARPDSAAVPAASVAVLVAGDEVTAAWGGPDGTLFQAASISKPVAALAALRLAAQGGACLDVDVNEYLTSWRLPGGDGKPPVTIRHLLCHGGALTVSGVPGYEQGEALPGLTEILDGLAPANTPAVRRDGPPCREHRYSGGGYVILQQLLEDVTAYPFAELAAELIFELARMTGATYKQPDPSDAAAAQWTAGRWSGMCIRNSRPQASGAPPQTCCASRRRSSARSQVTQGHYCRGRLPWKWSHHRWMTGGSV